MKYIQSFDSFLNEAMIAESTENTLTISKGSFDDYRAPLYEFSPVKNWFKDLGFNRGSRWGLEMIIPEVGRVVFYKTNFVIDYPASKKVDTSKFSVGHGTNFDMGTKRSWFNNSVTALELVARNMCRQSFVDEIQFKGPEIEYGDGLVSAGWTEGKHSFDPAKDKWDLLNWVDYAPSMLINIGTYKEFPEIEGSLKKLHDLAPKQITLNVI